MEIRIKAPKGTRITKQRLEIDEEQFLKDLTQFIDDRENKDFFNEELHQSLLKYGINEDVFEKMIESLEVYSSYDDADKEAIGFPYENWIPRLLEYYTVSD